MDLSIVIPVYNAEQYLSRCLDSLVCQKGDYKYEIICVDDCSTDTSLSILNTYKALFPDLINIKTNRSNIGVGSSRNQGINASNGEYIMFVDSDDFVESNYIQSFLNEMKRQSCDVLVGGYIFTSPKRSKKILLPHSLWTQMNFSSPWAKLFKRSFLLKNNLLFSESRFAEDTYLALAAYAVNARYGFFDYTGYHYWNNPMSLTRNKKATSKYEQLTSHIYIEFLNRYKTIYSNEEKYRVIEYSYISDMLNTILIYCRKCGWKQMKEKYSFFLHELDILFPDYLNNPYVGLFKPKGQRLKIKMGVTGFIMAKKLRVSKIVFFLAS